MEFREYYRGICALIRFDYITGTYLGELVNVPAASFVTGESYEDIKISLQQLVEDSLAVNALSPEEEWSQALELEQIRIRKDAVDLERSKVRSAVEQGKAAETPVATSRPHRQFLS